MKILENCITLASKVTLYIPATIHTTKAINNIKEVKAAAKLLSELFGGATSTPAVGYWMSDASGLVKEKTTLVFAYCNQADLENGIDEVVNFCRQLKIDMDQESVAMEINGTMYFV